MGLKIILFSQVWASPSTQEDKLVAKVGETYITLSQLEQATQDMEQQFSFFPEKERLARVLDRLIDINVLAKRAEEQNLLNDETIKIKIDFLKKRILHNSFFNRHIQTMVNDEDIKIRYQRERLMIKPKQEINARHILVKTKDQARAIIKELEEGKDFFELAKAKSIGSTGSKGGDLGFFGKGHMVPEFERAAFSLKPGEFTKSPVKSQFGYHIIKVEELRDVAPPTFEESKDKLRQLLLAEAYKKIVRESREAYKVQVLDETLKLLTFNQG
ncbi:peptidylprolyl isomerase [Candidatus Endowatersipora endosymbiont of Watersipora subatra]|uniref:peptidylprolyl isomerase n=1 Tax=Candidatus Endowatersipora endosymbiont of Watersipora subatra TaxID=3077946 RepID=UPI00312C7A8B